ncbi:unnamed protein product [Effrenium voratum]|uniref:Uncharacterized protein n=1 Tax=Effrenium voratum TaxID=2562239 RepID=A0AA36I5M9_9DINO|nr:unnamed protein product [Effrenium voratum]
MRGRASPIARAVCVALATLWSLPALSSRSFVGLKRERSWKTRCRNGPEPEERSLINPTLGLAGVGALLGPWVDAIHNQALLSYDLLPVSVALPLGVARSSLLVPPLLALAYALLGAVLPSALAALVPRKPREPREPRKPLVPLPPLPRALLAVASTCFIIKSSELLSHFDSYLAWPVLASLALLQWACLDGRLSSLFLALLAGLCGPLAELPVMWLGAWHYTAPDYWPLAVLGFGPGVPWAGLSILTGPCYFAVTTDAIALGRLFARL